jgi:hypothetical protein
MATTIDSNIVGRSNLNVPRPNLGTPQMPQGQALLRQMSVDVLSADDIESKSSRVLIHERGQAQARSNISMAHVVSSMGPPSLANAGRPSKVIDTPHNVGEIINQGLNTLTGTTEILRAEPVVSGDLSNAVNGAAMGTGAGLALLSVSAGIFVFVQQSKQIKQLEQTKQQVLLNLARSENPESGDPVPSSDRSERTIRRLDDQIKTARANRVLTGTTISASMVLGGATIGFMASGLVDAAMGTGTALGSLGVGLNIVGAVINAREIRHQSQVNQRLEAGLEGLQSASSRDHHAPIERRELTDSLMQVAQHATTAGQSRKSGKWVGLALNVLNGLTGTAAIAFKFLVAGSAAATAGTVLLAAGGVMAGAALVFGIYKLVRHLKLKKEAQVPLIDVNKATSADDLEKHQVLLKKNKYYALKQFVFELQRNTSEEMRATTLGYFETALKMPAEHAAVFYAELQDPDTSASATLLLADALFRGKPIQM